MGRSEPNLVPEWYKGTTNSAIGNSNSSHLSGSSHSDEHDGVFSSRNRISVSVCDFDSPRSSSSSDRISLRMSSSNDGYVGKEDITSRSYSSFGRSHRERDWDRVANRDKDFDLRERDGSLYPENELSNCPSMVNKTEKDSSRLIRSTISGHVDSWVTRNGSESSNGSSFGGINIASISKSSFERDFPSLGNEERHVALDVVRVSSPGLGTTYHSFPMTAASATIGSDAWTSALAEVPLVVGGNGPVISSSIQANFSLSIASSTSTGLNMAATLSQVPRCMQVGAQAPNDSQKIEELHRQQILKLRPMIPSMLKNSVLNSVDKTKTKGTRASEFTVSKTGQQSSHPAINITQRNALKTDVPKPLQPGNLQVLSREKNIFSPTRKNNPNPTNFHRVQTNSTAIHPAMIQSPKGVPNPKFKVDGRSACLGPSSSFPEKKPSQVQNRNDFFNSLRKKSYENQPTNANHSNTMYDASSNLGVAEQLGDNSSMTEEISLSDISLVENRICSAQDCEAEETEKLALDEKEVAFLRSLGWEENTGEEALTREEIESFLLEYNKLKPAVKLKI